MDNIQVVVDNGNFDESTLENINSGACLSVKGKLVESQGSGQQFEIHATEVELLGAANPDEYPIQPKKHSFEFLRENAHLRTRTNTFSAVMRLRSSLSFAIHSYFNKNGFYYMHTPIITASDAEGAGEMFKVSTLNPEDAKRDDKGQIDYSNDFFGKETMDIVE